MNLYDIIIIAIVLLFGVAGARRGLVWEIFTMAGIVIGLWMPYAFRFQIVEFVARYIGPGHLRIVATIAAFVFLFVAVYIVSSYIGYFLRKILRKAFLGWADRLLGVLAGLVKGILLVGVLVAVLLASPWHGQGQILVGKSKLLKWGKGQIERVIGGEFGHLRDRV